MGLHGKRLPHKYVVSYLVTFIERKTGGVEALKYELRIVAGVQGDADHLKLTDGCVQIIYGHDLLLQLFIEVVVVVR